MTAPMDQQRPYFLGCPVWANPDWVGSLYTGTDRRRWLPQYSTVFNTVEGNSTFYGLPSIETVQRWGEDTQDGFRFSLKFPRDISHDRELVQAGQLTDQFLQILEQLDRLDRLGPTFLQLAPTFSGRQFIALASYLKRLPNEFPFAVEVRHEDYFTNRTLEQDLNGLLSELRIDRVLFDSRPLFSGAATDQYERESQRRKPRLPHRTTVTGGRPVVRLVGRNCADATMPWIDEWATVIAEWISSGLTPFVFVHSPNEAFAPALAARLHDEIRIHRSDMPPLPEWPGRSQDLKKQRELF